MAPPDGAPPAPDTPGDSPEERIHARIGQAGPISFAEFMETALYGPGGYYTRGRRIDPEGDYFTSPSSHPAFGALVAVQLRDFWRLLGRPARFDAVELGAGDGTLARDVVAYAPRLDESFAGALAYTPVDRAATGRYVVADPPAGVTGCVLSNELLDAFPVHRFMVANGELRELFVTLENGRLVESPGPVSDPEIERRVAPLLASLPDGYPDVYRGEVNTGLGAWADRVGTILERGFVLTVDYGGLADELYRPGRAEGSLRAYYRHTLSQDPFRHIGEQDLTAHVDFSAVNDELAGAGFTALGMTTQTAFLDRLGLRSLINRLPGLGLPSGEVEANRMPMLWLARPDGLGRFKVTFHAKGVAAGRAPLGLDGRGGGHDTDELPVPLLARDDSHFDLTGGMYPGTGATIGTWSEILGEDETGEA